MRHLMTADLLKYVDNSKEIFCNAMEHNRVFRFCKFFKHEIKEKVITIRKNIYNRFIVCKYFYCIINY